MTKKEKTSIAKERLAFYDRLIQSIPNLERKGATMPYTSLNGHMFSFLAKDGSLGLRLPKETREAFLTQYKTTLCEAYGTVMKEYVLVPESLFVKTEELEPYFIASLDYVKYLKPKPTKK